MKTGEMDTDLDEFIEEYLKELRHKKMTKDIKSSSAKAVIAAAMKDTGLKYHYSGQTHRAVKLMPQCHLLRSSCGITIFYWKNLMRSIG